MLLFNHSLALSLYPYPCSYQTSAAQQVHVTNDKPEALRVDFKLSPVVTSLDGISSYYNPYFF